MRHSSHQMNKTYRVVWPGNLLLRNWQCAAEALSLTIHAPGRRYASTGFGRFRTLRRRVRLGAALSDKVTASIAYSAAAPVTSYTNASARQLEFPGGPDSRKTDFSRGESAAIDMIGRATKRRLAADAYRWPERRRRPLKSDVPAQRKARGTPAEVAPAFLRRLCRKDAY